jgi:hypothetical protein
MDVEEVGSVEVPAAVLSEMSFIPADHVWLVYRERALQLLDWITLIKLSSKKISTVKSILCIFLCNRISS